MPVSPQDGMKDRFRALYALAGSAFGLAALLGIVNMYVDVLRSSSTLRGIVNLFWPVFVALAVVLLRRAWRGPRDASSSLRTVGAFQRGTLLTFVALNALGFVLSLIVKSHDEGPATLLFYLSILVSPIVGMVLSARVMRRPPTPSPPRETTKR